MPPRINVNIGDKYNNLTIIEEVEKYNGRRYFRCLCDCGQETIARFISLRSGKTKSCGCRKIINLRTNAIRHGKHKTRLYRVWAGMIQRCYNKNAKAHKHYGYRGIIIDETWRNDFLNFERWALENGYKDNLTIERLNVNGNYVPSNCIWIPQSHQMRNTRRSKILTLNGESHCVTEWARKIGIANSSMVKRLKNWPIEKALSTIKMSL